MYLLGCVEFESAVRLQQMLLAELAQQQTRNGILLLCEHPPTLTLGRESSLTNLRSPPEDLQRLGLRPRWINRGGGTLIHSPGQLAIYPLLPLSPLGLGLVNYRQILLQALAEVCEESHVTATIEADAAVVLGRTGPLGCVGAAVRSGISYHGAFLNVSPDPNWSRHFTLLTGHSRMSSLVSGSMRPVSMSAVREGILRRIAAAGGYNRYHVGTGHPYLRRSAAK